MNTLAQMLAIESAKAITMMGKKPVKEKYSSATLLALARRNKKILADKNKKSANQLK